ncbi:MAG: retropepsin-like aspartic protease [bacterium]
MSVIQKEILLAGSRGKLKSLALFDNGATYSCIKPEIAERLGTPEPLPEPMTFGTADSGTKVTAGSRIALNFHINGCRLSDEFMIISSLSENVIIGAKTLQAWRIKLDFENDEVIVDPRVTELRLI